MVRVCFVCFQSHPEFPDQVSAEITTPLSILSPSSFTPGNLTVWQLGKLPLHTPGKGRHPKASSSPGSPTGALQIPSQRTRGCVPNWVAPLKRARSSTLLAPQAPGNHLPRGNPESPEFLNPCPEARWEAPPKFPPEPAAKGGRREGGAGTRGRNRDSRARRVWELGCSADCKAGQLAAAPRSGAWETEPRFPARSPPSRPKPGR